MVNDDDLLKLAGQSPVQSDRHFILDQWESVRDSGIKPLKASELGGSEADRLEFLTGARLLGFRRKGRTLKPQQLRLHDMLAVGHRRNAVLMSRRASKSASLYGELIGRAASPEREGFRVGVFTATSGKAGRSRFLKDVAPMVDRYGDDRVQTYRGAGQERLEWHDTDSGVFWLNTVDDIRSERFDVVLIDEAGEPDSEKVADINDAVRFVMDTVTDGAQLIVAGTAGRYREGNLLWQALQREGGGLLHYGMPDGTTVDDVSTWAQARELLLLAHPGIGTLTTEEIQRENWEDYARENRLTDWLRELGSVFGDEGGTTKLVRPGQWEALALGGVFPEPPAHFGLAMAQHPSGTVASIVAAWRENGEARLLLLDWREGSRWISGRAHELERRYRVPLVYDGFGPILVAAEELGRMNPRPKLEPQMTRDVTTASALLIREIETGKLGHWNQPRLTAAILGVVRRKVGNGWALGRPSSDADITAAEAGAMALRWYDANPKRERIGIISAA